MASPSERLAEVRAALLELEACVAKYRGVRVPRRAAAPAAAAVAGGSSAGSLAAGSATGGGVTQRILRPRLNAFVGWWRKSRAKGPGVASASRD